MAERLSEVEARIGSVRQLSAVITAMRGIAAARSREAASRLDGVRAYAATVETAIAEALVLAPQAPPARAAGAGRHLLILLCAEQGFAGGFNTRLLDAAQPHLRGNAECLLVGARGASAAAERGLAPAAFLPMAVHADQTTALASRIADHVLERAAGTRLTRVTILHAMPSPAPPGAVATRPILPFDYSRIAPTPRATPPLVTLPPAELLARLTEEYVFATLCEALLLSHAAENEARTRAMVAARDNVAETLDGLTGKARLLRQAQITDELIELSAGTMASNG